MDETQQHEWYLVQLKPNCAKIAIRNLERQGLATFLPLESRTVRKRGKFVTAEAPLFPGYLFVSFDIASGCWQAVNSTYGVNRLVSFADRPAAAPPGLIAELMARCSESGTLKPAPEFAPGDQVMISGGPCASFIAKVQSLESEQRIWLLMDLLGKETRVAAHPSAVRRVSAGSETGAP